MNKKNEENNITEEEKEETIRIIILAEDKLFSLNEEKIKIENEIAKLKNQLKTD